MQQKPSDFRALTNATNLSFPAWQQQSKGASDRTASATDLCSNRASPIRQQDRKGEAWRRLMCLLLAQTNALSQIS